MHKNLEIARVRRRVRILRALGRVALLPFGGALILVLKWVLRYRIEDRAHWRAVYQEALAAGKPLLICSNHLTYVDSVLLIYALSHHMRYVFNFRTLTWNLPAIEYSKNPFFALVGICGKCIFINRKGSRDHFEAIFEVAAELMRAGEPFTIFPEGRRSRTGYFDDRKLAYGIGKIATRLPELQVLCFYMRAEGQQGHSGFPKPGSCFKLTMKRLEFRPTANERETVQTVTETIARTIRDMEGERLDGVRSPDPGN